MLKSSMFEEVDDTIPNIKVNSYFIQIPLEELKSNVSQFSLQIYNYFLEIATQIVNYEYFTYMALILLAVKIIFIIHGLLHRTPTQIQQDEANLLTVSEPQKLRQKYHRECQNESNKNIIESQFLLEASIEQFHEQSEINITVQQQLLKESVDQFQVQNLSIITETQNQLRQLFQSQNTSPSQAKPQIKQYLKVHTHHISKSHTQLGNMITQFQEQCRIGISEQQRLLQTQILHGQEVYKSKITQQQSFLETQLEVYQLELNSTLSESQSLLLPSQDYSMEINPCETESQVQFWDHIYQYQEEGRSKITKSYELFRMQIQNEFGGSKNKITESQILLNMELQQQSDINNSSISQQQGLLLSKGQKLQAESIQNTTAQQNQLQTQIVTCFSECRTNLKKSQTLIQTQIKKCKDVCKNNTDEAYSLMDQLTQQGQVELKHHLIQSQTLLNNLIQLNQVEINKHISLSQSLLQRQMKECLHYYAVSIKESENQVKTIIEQCQVDNLNNIQLQNVLQSQIQQCFVVSLQLITEQQNLMLDNLQQCCQEYRDFIMEIQNLLLTYVNQCFNEIMLNPIKQLETIIQQLQDESRKQIKQSKSQLSRQVKQCQEESKQNLIKNQSKQTQQPHIAFSQCEHLSDKNQLADLKSQLNEQIEEYITHLKLNNQIEDPTNYKVPQNIDVDNQEILFFVLGDQFKQAEKQLFVSNQQNNLNIYALQGMFTENAQDCVAYNVTFQETAQLTYEQVSADINAKLAFEMKFVQSLALDLGVKPEQIKISSIEKGSIKVNYTIIDCAGVNKLYKNTTLEQLKKEFPESSPTLEMHPYFAEAALSAADFEPKYNMEWPREGSALRGPKDNSLTYYFPQGWKGYALKVSGLYGANDNWLAMDQNPEEWYVLYHGTKMENLKNIMDNRKNGGLNAGPGQVCSDFKWLNHPGQSVGRGVYFSNHIEVCVSYTQPTKIGEKNFRAVFQSRVNPRGVRQCEKKSSLSGKANLDGWDNDYFVVGETKNIRPYRILIKQE